MHRICIYTVNAPYYRLPIFRGTFTIPIQGIPQLNLVPIMHSLYTVNAPIIIAGLYIYSGLSQYTNAYTYNNSIY